MNTSAALSVRSTTDWRFRSTLLIVLSLALAVLVYAKISGFIPLLGWRTATRVPFLQLAAMYAAVLTSAGVYLRYARTTGIKEGVTVSVLLGCFLLAGAIAHTHVVWKTLDLIRRSIAPWLPATVLCATVVFVFVLKRQGSFTQDEEQSSELLRAAVYLVVALVVYITKGSTPLTGGIAFREGIAAVLQFVVIFLGVIMTSLHFAAAAIGAASRRLPNRRLRTVFGATGALMAPVVMAFG
jgi:hypothetical protein